MSDEIDFRSKSHISSDGSSLSDRGTAKIHIAVLFVVAAAAFASLGTSPPMWSWSKSAEAEPTDVVIEPGYVAIYDVQVDFGWNTEESDGTGLFRVEGWYDSSSELDVDARVIHDDGTTVRDDIAFTPLDERRRGQAVYTPDPECDEAVETPCRLTFQVEVANRESTESTQTGWHGRYEWSYTTHDEEEGEQLEEPDGELDLQIDFVSIQSIADRQQQDQQNGQNDLEQQ